MSDDTFSRLNSAPDLQAPATSLCNSTDPRGRSPDPEQVAADPEEEEKRITDEILRLGDRAEALRSTWRNFYTRREKKYSTDCDEKPIPLDFIVHGVRPIFHEHLYYNNDVTISRIEFPKYLSGVVFMAKIYEECAWYASYDWEQSVEYERAAHAELCMLWDKSIPRLFCPVQSNVREWKPDEGDQSEVEVCFSWAERHGLLLQDYPNTMLLRDMRKDDFATMPLAAIKAAAEVSLRAIHEQGWIVGNIAPEYMLVGKVEPREGGDDRGDSKGKDDDNAANTGKAGAEEGAKGDRKQSTAEGAGEALSGVRVLFVSLGWAQEAWEEKRIAEMVEMQEMFDKAPARLPGTNTTDRKQAPGDQVSVAEVEGTVWSAEEEEYERIGDRAEIIQSIPLDFASHGVRPRFLEHVYHNEDVTLSRVDFPKVLPDIVFMSRIYQQEALDRAHPLAVKHERNVHKALRMLWGKSIPRLFCLLQSNVGEWKTLEDGRLNIETYYTSVERLGFLFQDYPSSKLLLDVRKEELPLMPLATLKSAAEVSLGAIHNQGWLVGNVAPRYMLIIKAEPGGEQERDGDESGDGEDEDEEEEDGNGDDGEENDSNEDDSDEDEDLDNDNGESCSKACGNVNEGGGKDTGENGGVEEAERERKGEPGGETSEVRTLFLNLAWAERRAPEARMRAEMVEMQQMFDNVSAQLSGTI
ncbi:hypothetical protein BOTBODRAFT_146545 [Botryobasidium botryosum FD-172 SS1]|uniref:Protein kinase domain-containing protein n=1 Tax=Botryobasidium botryosum (strain FD-172 SS1) TaxID=930990 RepID=A0A067MDI1_BOTB1|nr:hypothetical protein BOTBODRAFT_146545 [Botryobasidium botryosum FD-172 SS1]